MLQMQQVPWVRNKDLKFENKIIEIINLSVKPMIGLLRSCTLFKIYLTSVEQSGNASTIFWIRLWAKVYLLLPELQLQCYKKNISWLTGNYIRTWDSILARSRRKYLRHFLYIPREVLFNQFCASSVIQFMSNLRASFPKKVHFWSEKFKCYN